MLAEANVSAEGPQVAAMGVDALQFGSKEVQFTTDPLRSESSPSCASRATPRGSTGPPAPDPAGRVAKSRRSPAAPTVYGMQVVPSVVGGLVEVSSKVACTW